jgi:hypothetical protein
MALIDFKKWQTRTAFAVILGLIIFITVLSVTPIYGFNITPQATGGTSNVGGWFGELHPIEQGYSGG